MTHNFRSEEGIVSYSRLFDDNYKYSAKFDFAEFNSVCLCPTVNVFERIGKIVSDIKSHTPEDSIMILLRKNDKITALKESNEVFEDFKIKIDLSYSDTEHADFFSLIMKIVYGRETLYGLTKIMTASKVHENYSKLSELLPGDSTRINVSELHTFVRFVGNLIELDISEDELQLFDTAIFNEQQVNFVLESEQQYSILTIHSAKGLEADHVIFVTSDTFVFEMGRRRFDEQVHYVAITRPRKKLWILDTCDDYIDIVNRHITLDKMRPILIEES